MTIDLGPDVNPGAVRPKDLSPNGRSARASAHDYASRGRP
jgi:hypothetical protein